MSSFVQKCINGYALTSEIDDYVDQWHGSDSDEELHEFLGMTKKEYSLYVQDEGYLPIIIAAHKTNTEIVSLIKNEFALAARSNDAAKSKQLQKWLENEKLWD